MRLFWLRHSELVKSIVVLLAAVILSGLAFKKCLQNICYSEQSLQTAGIVLDKSTKRYESYLGTELEYVLVVRDTGGKIHRFKVGEVFYNRVQIGEQVEKKGSLVWRVESNQPSPQLQEQRHDLTHSLAT